MLKVKKHLVVSKKVCIFASEIKNKRITIKKSQL